MNAIGYNCLKGLLIAVRRNINVISIFLGYLSLTYILAVSTEQIKNAELTNNIFLNIIIILLSMFVSALFHIFFHEFGHLVCGKISGYSFVSFRVGNIIIIKEKDKIKLKRFYIPGMPGQCLMSPPSLTNNTYPCALYLLGGGLFNLIATIVADFVAYKLFTDSIASVFIIFIFGSIGIYFFIINIFPMNLGSAMNDGYVLFLENEKGKLANYYLLKINHYSSEKINFSEFSSDFLSELFDFDYSDIDSPCIANLYLYAGQIYAYNKKYESAKNCYERISDSKSVDILRSMAKCERIFLDILENGENANPEKYMDVNTKIFMKKMKNSLTMLRIQYALHLFYIKDYKKAKSIREKFMNGLKSCPTKVDSDYEITMLKIMEDKYEVKIQCNEILLHKTT